MKMYLFEKLDVWHESIALIKTIYTSTASFPSEEKFGLWSKLRRASISISSNLVEGTSGTTAKDKAHFTTISSGSAMEALNQLIISKDLGFISENDYILARNKIEKITNMLSALRNYQLNK